MPVEPGKRRVTTLGQRPGSNPGGGLHGEPTVPSPPFLKSGLGMGSVSDASRPGEIDEIGAVGLALGYTPPVSG